VNEELCNTRLKMKKILFIKISVFLRNQILRMINLLVLFQCSINLENLYPRRHIFLKGILLHFRMFVKN